jgi:hypothetical protein
MTNGLFYNVGPPLLPFAGIWFLGPALSRLAFACPNTRSNRCQSSCERLVGMPLGDGSWTALVRVRLLEIRASPASSANAPGEVYRKLTVIEDVLMSVEIFANPHVPHSVI